MGVADDVLNNVRQCHKNYVLLTVNSINYVFLNFFIFKGCLHAHRSWHSFSLLEKRHLQSKRTPLYQYQQ